MINFFNTIITRPFGWVLYQLWEFIGSYGIALIIFTLLAKIILLPFQMKSKKSMVDMQRIQPQLKELEKKYKNNKEQYSLAVQKLYKKEKVSLTGGCLPLLLTMPIMLGLYAVVRQPLTFMFGFDQDLIRQIAEIVGVATDNVKNMSYLEIEIASKMGEFQTQLNSIIPNLKVIDFHFLGLDLAAIPQLSQISVLWIIPALSGLTSYAYSMLVKKYQPAPASNNDQAQAMNGCTTYMMPLMSVYIAFIVPGGLGFYWVVNNVLMMAQEPLLNWYYTKYKPSKAAK